MSVKDSCTRSSGDCKHRQPPASRGLLRWRALKPLHRADGRWRKLFFLSLLLCLLKTVFSLLTTNPHTHTHTKQQAGRFDNIAFICLRLSRALSLIIDNFSFGFESPALILKQLGCQLFSWKPGIRRRRLDSSKLKMYRVPATLSWRWQ